MVAVCDMVVMEILTSARDQAEFPAMEEALGYGPWSRIDAQDWDRARAVTGMLADCPVHPRSVRIPDL